MTLAVRVWVGGGGGLIHYLHYDAITVLTVEII